MSDVPALVLGRGTEVMAWNRLGHALLAGHYDAAAPSRPAGRPNLTRMLFLDLHTRDLYACTTLSSGISRWSSRCCTFPRPAAIA
jgi:hypothetical protein